MLLAANCRKFVIQLAEYCNVPTTEINMVISSQYYSTTDAVKGTVDGTKQIAKGNVINGSSKIGTSLLKNSAKIVVSTGNQIIDTSKFAVDQTTNKVIKRK